ncbi:CBN-GES-1 protein [Aphelenchoides avenae]|nr:CBN-GES-1 protein [Aphelenchus avenae]
MTEYLCSDQTEALKWLHDNIVHFGGNPERITAWGMSAGAGSVGQMTLSPLSRDLFSQAILMSGSHLAGWSTSANVPDATKELAKSLGCPTGDSRALKKCFKSKRFEEFIAAVEKSGAVDREIAFGKFVPRIDGEFIPQDYEELLHDAPPKPTVMGFTEHESIFFALMGASPSISALLVTPDQYGAFNNDKLVGSIRDVFASDAKLGSKAEAVRKELIRFYAERNVPRNPDYSFYLTKYTEIQTDVQFVLPALLDAQERARLGWPTYLYVNRHYNEKHFPEGFPAKGCVHASELIPLFGLLLAPVELDERDRQHQQLLAETLANFAKTGNPSTGDIYWPPLTTSFPSRHLSLSATPTVNETFNEQLVSFWSSLFDKYGTDVLHYAPPSKKKRKDEL